MKQTLTELKGEIDSYAVIVEDFSTPFTYRTSEQRINKDVGDLNNTVKQLDLTGIYKIFQ